MAGTKISIELVVVLSLCWQFLYFFGTIKLGSCSGVSNANSCLAIEREALLSFKEDLDDPSGRLSSWVGDDCCKWEGVICSAETGRVVRLHLSNPFPSNPVEPIDGTVYEIGGKLNSSLLALKDLSYLDLSMNNFGGSPIPSFVGSFENLRYLNLSGSSFGGAIPPRIGNLSILLYLDLNRYTNELVGNDLSWLSGLSSLEHLNLGGVDLSLAANNWLETISTLPSLVELHLPGCGLTNLPSSLPFVNLSSLSVLELSNNGFINSTIPVWLFQLRSLTYLDLGSNGLQGGIPDGFAVLKFLKHLDLSNNWYIEGKLSKNLGKLCNLRKLILNGNNLNGELSDLIDGFSSCNGSNSLESLDLGYNELGGFLPSSLGNLRNLKYLGLTENSFIGSLPESIGNLSSLSDFSISKNLMNGSIPVSLGQLSALAVLDLSVNPWNGVITEVHLFNLSSLKQLSITTTTSRINLVFNVSPDWIPPFKLKYLDIKSCQVGPDFPAWLRNQDELNFIVFKNAMISDVIPDWFLKLNLQLSWLELAYNNLSGRVPNTFVFEDQAFLDLTSNRFEGPLPRFSSNLSTLYLRNNQFSGTIPHNIGQLMPKLANYDISENFLHGTIPTSLGEIATLTSLTVSGNNLTGEIPLIWDDKINLYIVDLANNSLTGEIPSSMGSLSSLMFLSLSNNNLAGEIPSSLQNCTLMWSLNLGDNMLSGEVPSWIGEKMSALLIIRLRSNLFGGNIPPRLCALSDLHILDLAGNRLSGTVPSCLGNLTGMATDIDNARYEGQLSVIAKGRELYYQSTLYLVNVIDLSGNNLSGEMPKELTNLSRLGTLNLSMNHLTGKIPGEIGSLQRLETLDLSMNRLSGPIPPSLTSLTALNHLNLSYNNFSGRIPTSNQFSTLDPSTYMKNPGLCGFPLTTKCFGDDKTSHSPSANTNDDDENGDKSGTMWFYVSMALGFIVGFWGFFGPLIVKQSWRQAYFGFVESQVLSILAYVGRLQRKLKSKGN